MTKKKWRAMGIFLVISSSAMVMWLAYLETISVRYFTVTETVLPILVCVGLAGLGIGVMRKGKAKC